MPVIKETHPWVGKDVICVNAERHGDGGEAASNNLFLYQVYRVTRAIPTITGCLLYLDGLTKNWRDDRFILVSDMPEEALRPNRFTGGS